MIDAKIFGYILKLSQIKILKKIINAVFSKVNPIPAAAQPEYELSIEITTGISAPPIGIINKKPIKKEITNKVQNKFEDCVEHKR